jgi:predicted unusual protein kinase regulating ubiquinone biosynthesis (AarF/ABC1/UbiB family)
VHRARTDDGREVVVKVQYPGVDEAVDSDLAHLKIALRASGLVKLEKKALDSTFQELRERLHEELDYCIEADNVRRFREFHAERHPFVAIPEVIGERSSQRVLTLTYLTGRPMSEVNELGYTQEERNRLGWNLLTFMVTEIFELQAIHADPNPGNFALRKDGTIVVYDFGCVKELPPHIVLAYRDMITQGLAEDYAASHDALDRLGIIRPGGPRVTDDYYKQWRDIFANPFLNDNCFDFGRSDVHDRVITMVPGVIQRMGAFQPSKHLIFLDRMIAGHYGNLCALRAKVSVLPLVRPFLDGLHVDLPDDAQQPAFPAVPSPPAPQDAGDPRPSLIADAS